VPSSATDTWTCPSCRRAIATAYCSTCGERRRDPRELTLRGLLHQAFEAFTNIDGRVLRSFRTLITRPGVLTVAFIEGRRKPFLGPVALFLVANVIFFAAESFTSGLVFSTPLQSHMSQQPWDALARTLVARHLAADHTTLALYAPGFDAAIPLHARSLIMVMVVAFAPLVGLVFHARGRPFAAHAVFSLHLYAYLLMLLSLGTTVPAIWRTIDRSDSSARVVDTVLSIGLLILCAVYLYSAIGQVYGGSRGRRAVSAAALSIATAVTALGYRFALFLLTLYTT
jgi:Protein of unknown function (DUF3667)